MDLTSLYRALNVLLKLVEFGFLRLDVYVHIFFLVHGELLFGHVADCIFCGSSRSLYASTLLIFFRSWLLLCFVAFRSRFPSVDGLRLG